MLRSVLLEGFRSFDQPTAVRFAPLTILAGPNNAGKSSVIQALLALVQSEQASSGDALLLSGAWCDLGRFDEVVSANRPLDQRRFAIGINGATSRGRTVDTLWQVGPPDDAALASALIQEIEYSLDKATGRLTRERDRFKWTEEALDIEEQPLIERSGRAFFTHPGLVDLLEQGSLSTPDEPRPPRYLVKTEIRFSPLDASRTQYVGPFRAPPQPLYTPRVPSWSPIGANSTSTCTRSPAPGRASTSGLTSLRASTSSTWATAASTCSCLAEGDERARPPAYLASYGTLIRHHVSAGGGLCAAGRAGRDPAPTEVP